MVYLRIAPLGGLHLENWRNSLILLLFCLDKALFDVAVELGFELQVCNLCS